MKAGEQQELCSHGGGGSHRRGGGEGGGGGRGSVPGVVSELAVRDESTRGCLPVSPSELPLMTSHAVGSSHHQKTKRRRHSLVIEQMT